MQAIVHVLVLVAAWFVLPIHVSAALGPPNSDHPALWLRRRAGALGRRAVRRRIRNRAAAAILVRAHRPRDAHDPYYLYAASNLGSFGGLLAYPDPHRAAARRAGAERARGRPAMCCVGALIVARRRDGDHRARRRAEAARAHRPPRRAGASARYWIAAAAVPSALSLGVTLHISTDVASAPMLWVVPLALYLATFVLAFMQGQRKARTGATLLIHPFALALMVIVVLRVGQLGRARSRGILGRLLLQRAGVPLWRSRARARARTG